MREPWSRPTVFWPAGGRSAGSTLTGVASLAELLELLYTARRRFRSIQGLYHRRVDVEVLDEAWRAAAETGRVAEPVDEVEGWDDEEGDDDETQPEETVRFWIEGQRSRLERPGQLEIDDGEHRWLYGEDSGAGFSRSRERPPGEHFGHLLDPSPLMSALEFEPATATRAAGRDALLARARRRGTELPFGIELEIGDEFELLVDRERGVLLSLRTLFGGRELELEELLEVGFDEPIPEELFRFEPPPGVELQDFDERDLDQEEEVVPLAEAAARAPFHVWALSRLPADDWFLVHTEVTRAGEAVEGVSLWYRSVDGTQNLTLQQQPRAGPGEPIGFGWTGYPPVRTKRVERDGIAYLVIEHDDAGVIRWEREGTVLSLSGNIPTEVLLDLAASVKPA
jgi:hypothetical protein